MKLLRSAIASSLGWFSRQSDARARKRELRQLAGLGPEMHRDIGVHAGDVLYAAAHGSSDSPISHLRSARTARRKAHDGPRYISEPEPGQQVLAATGSIPDLRNAA